MQYKFTFIGIVGPSGAGKTSLAKMLKANSNEIEHIRLDNYFKSPKSFSKKFGFRNWEKPSNLKFEILLRHLKQLAKGKMVKTKSFPKKVGAKSKPITLRPKRYIVVEGFMLYKNKAIRNFLDKRIYLEVPQDTMLKRRAIRFGATHINDYDTKVAIPEFLRYGITQKKFADFVVNATKSQLQVYKQVLEIIIS